MSKAHKIKARNKRSTTIKSSYYRYIHATILTALFVIPTTVLAENWGSLQREGCNGTGVARYSAVLWNIPWGKSWEDSCKTTPLAHKGISYNTIECANENGVKMWGKFNLPDSSCDLDASFLEEVLDKNDIPKASQACYKATLESTKKYKPTDGCSNTLVDPATFAYRDVFFPACVIHDACYSTPGTTQSSCDLIFKDAMHRLCRREGFLNQPACHIASDVWYAAVALKGGPSYEKRQVATGQEPLKSSIEHACGHLSQH